MSRLHRALAALVPGERSEWIRAHGAELDALTGPKDRLRWRVGVLPLFLSTLATQIVREPRSLRGSMLVRLISAGVSASALGIGAVLAYAFVSDGTRSATLLATCLGILALGTFNLAVVAVDLDRRWSAGRSAAYVVNAVALSVGVAGLGLAALTLTSGDPEFGPFTVAAVAALGGFLSLAAIDGAAEAP